MLLLFRKWIISIAAGAFFITFILSYILLGVQAEYFAEKQMEVTLNYLKQKILRREFNTINLQNYYKKNLIEKAKVFASFKKKYPDLLTPSFLSDYLKKSGVDQISILNKDGRYTFSYPYKITGTKEKSKPVILDAENSDGQIELEHFQIQSKKFTGISISDEIGIIQIGQYIDKYHKMLKSENISTIAEFLKVGYSGNILIIENNVIVSSDIENVIGKTVEEINFKFPAVKDTYTSFKTRFKGNPIFGISIKYNQYALVGIYPEQELFSRRKNILKWGIPLYFILFLFLYLFIVILLKITVIKSIKSINTSLSKITAGDLNEYVNVTTTPEFQDLSSMINVTVNSLRKETAKVTKSIKQELHFAREVQFAALPKVFPPFPLRTEFDIFASLHAAKEVSGDFFDFFTIQFDDSKLIFLVADVSGKGIPASLFMMSSRALIKRYAQDGKSIEEIFYLVNKALCEDNTTSMFLTIWLGMLEVNTGRLTYVNAGHNMPYLQKQGGIFKQIHSKPNYPLGVMPDAQFTENEILLKYNDTIFIYTDGITEAEDSDGNLYGEEKLADVLNENKTETVQNLIKKVGNDVLHFTNDAVQSDDITMLCLRYQGESKTVPAQIKYEEQVVEFFFNILQKNNCSEEIQNEFGIMIDEIFTNISLYAYPEEKGNVTVFCSVGGYPKTIKMQFIDSGIPFNPLNSVEENLDAPVHEREVGHLGVFLVKNLADQATYEYKDEKNILTIFKTL